MKIAFVCEASHVESSVAELLFNSPETEAWQLLNLSMTDVLDKAVGGTISAVLLHMPRVTNAEKKFVEVMSAPSQKVPVIALSNGVSEEDILKILSLGADDCLSLEQASAQLIAHSIKSAVLRRNSISKPDIDSDCAKLLGSLSEGIIVLDEMDVIHFANASARRLLGSGESPLAGERFSISIKCEQKMELVMSSGGRAVPVEFKKTEVIWRSRRAYLLTLTDMTDQYAERARVKTFEQVGQKKEDFLASLCHEIRTPLNVVTNIGKKLSQKDLGSDTQELLQLLKISTDSLNALINDIRDLSKTQSGTLRIDRTVMTLKDVVKDSLDVVSELAREKSLSLDLEFEQSLNGPVAGDPNRIRQILTNLLTNSLKFTREGGISVKVWQVSRNANQSVARIEICDTGIGIGKSELETIFEPYAQTKLSRRKQQGSGLGLTICKRLSELMGGRIGCQSALGKGSTFWLELPFEVLSTDKQKKSLAKTVELPICKWKSVKLGAIPLTDSEGSRDFFSESIQELKETKVLIVDDTEINRELLKLDLMRLGHSVDVSFDGLDAVRRAAQYAYDMIVLDLELPELSGLEAAKQICKMQQQSGRHHVPIIAWTANTLDGLPTSWFDGFFSKRYQMEELEGLCNLHMIKKTKKTSGLHKPEEFELDAKQESSFPLQQMVEVDNTSAQKHIKSHVNASRFKELCNLSKENPTACDLLRSFIRDTNELLNDLQSQITNTDQEACLSQIHKLKGSCSFLGIETAAVMCKEVEQLIKVDSWEEIKPIQKLLQTMMHSYIRQARSALAGCPSVEDRVDA